MTSSPEPDLPAYVPAPGSSAESRVLPGSAITGTPAPDAGMILCDFEGNRYASPGLASYAQRMLHAAGRHTERYPTVARALLPAAELEQIGWYDPNTRQVVLDGPQERARLAQWLGVPDVSDAELQAR